LGRDREKVLGRRVVNPWAEDHALPYMEFGMMMREFWYFVLFLSFSSFLSPVEKMV